MPAECSGISASRNRCHTSSTASSGSLSRYTFRFWSISGGNDALMSAYSDSIFVGWFVSNEYALMLNVNSGGVRSIHSTEFFSDGG